MKRKITAGTTNFTLPVFVYDTTSTTGGGLAGLTHTTPGLILEYRREGQSSWTQLGVGTGLVAGVALGTFTSGGIIADGAQAGAYELGLPNAAIAAGARFVLVRFRGAANMFCPPIEIELDNVEYQTAFFNMQNLTIGVGTLGTVLGDINTNTIQTNGVVSTRFNQSFIASVSAPALDLAGTNNAVNCQRIQQPFAGIAALQLSSGSSVVFADWISANNGDGVRLILGDHGLRAGAINVGSGDVIEATNAGQLTVVADSAIGATGVRLSGTAGAVVVAAFGSLICTGSPIVDAVNGTIELTAGVICCGAALAVTNATVTIRNTVIDGNVTVSGGSLRLVNCTVTGTLTRTGGVVLLEGTTTVRGTITGTVTRTDFGARFTDLKNDTVLIPATL